MMALSWPPCPRVSAGVRPVTIAMLEAMARQGPDTGCARPGFGGRVGDLAPLAHLAAAMIGVGEMVVGEMRLARGERTRKAPDLRPSRSPKGRLALLNGTQFSTAHALAALFEAETLFKAALITAPFPPKRPKARTPRSIAHTRPAPAQRSIGRRALRALMAGSAIRASHLVANARVQDPYSLRCQPQVWRGLECCARPPDPGRRGQRSHRTIADLRRHRRSSVGEISTRAGGLRRRQ